MTDEDKRVPIREIIVVEGLHDRQAVERAVQADVWVLGGDRVARQLLAELRRAAQNRGVIVLTDPDGPGERIRRRVDAAVPGCRHAALTRRQASTARGVGVEHAQPSDILAALLNARGGAAPEGLRADVFTREDLLAMRMVGDPHAAARRQAVGDLLGIGTGNAKAFLRKLNALGITRSEWEEATARVCPQTLTKDD